jgi:hypothetical protein
MAASSCGVAVTRRRGVVEVLQHKRMTAMVEARRCCGSDATHMYDDDGGGTVHPAAEAPYRGGQELSARSQPRWSLL